MATKVITGKVRLSYVNIFRSRAFREGQDAKYSICLLIPKEDKAGIAKIRAAMDAAMDVFRKTREGETLLTLRYDEAYSLAWVTARDAEPDGNTIVLLATYRDADGRQHSGRPWVLLRNENGSWNVEEMK
jgi:hypothetical protein